MFKKVAERSASLALSLLLLLSSLAFTACRSDEKDKTPEGTTQQAELLPSDESAATTAALRKIDSSDLPEIESYIASCVNGPFREYTPFPDFISVQQLSPLILSGSELLLKATKSVGLESFPRSQYEVYLQENFHPDITLPAGADYRFGYDKDTDSFRNDYELAERNFRPFSIWLDPELSREGQDIYFDAYELNYEFVNAETGREERENPIARMVVDDVTVGFSAPIARQDLHLIDHRPLAKTRYTLRPSGKDGFQMISKTKLSRDAAYKASAMKLFADVEAMQGSLFRLGGDTLGVRDWASEDAQILGTLEEGTLIWYVNPLPTTGYVLGAPAASYEVFDYRLGFGFMAKQYIG